MPCKEEVDDSQREYLRPEVKSIFLSVKNTRKRRQENTLLRGGWEQGAAIIAVYFGLLGVFGVFGLLGLLGVLELLRPLRPFCPIHLCLSSIVSALCLVKDTKSPLPLQTNGEKYFSLLNKYKNDAGGVNTSYKVNLCR